MRMRLLAMAILASACAGCSTTVVRETPRAISVADGATADMRAVAEALLDLKGTRVQAVVGSWKDNAFTAEFVMKGDGQRLTVAALAPAMRLATITLERPHSLRYERSRRIPAAFEPEYLLFDLAVVNLDTGALSRALGESFDVRDDGTCRVVAPRAGGKPGAVAVLSRNADGTVKFTNLRHSYEYTVTRLQ